MMRKICVVTSSRADYGLLRWVMEGVKSSSGLDLQVIATGMHLSTEFGFTFREIESDGFRISHKVEMLLSSDTSSGVSKSMGLGLIGFADALEQLKPDMVLVLGDRFEILSAVTAAMIARIPVAHLHGGETTEGAFDEAIRHSITKMSHLHFVAAEEYRDRVIQLGEDPERVFLVGGLGIDSIKKLKLLTRGDLEKAIDFKLADKNLLVTFHPVTLEDSTAAEQVGELLAALDGLSDTNIIFTMPNADTGGSVIAQMIIDYVSQHENTSSYTSLGQLRYLSCVKHVDGVVGNSSSGLIEVPSLQTGSINIGDRQLGRLKADSVIDCKPNRQSITKALKKLYQPEYTKMLSNVKNPYGDGEASDRVVDVLQTYPFENILKKQFYNLSPGK